MERGFLIFVHPDNGDRVVLIDLKKGLQLVSEDGISAGCGEKDEAQVGGTLSAQALLTIGLVCQM